MSIRRQRIGVQRVRKIGQSLAIGSLYFLSILSTVRADDYNFTYYSPAYGFNAVGTFQATVVGVGLTFMQSTNFSNFMGTMTALSGPNAGIAQNIGSLSMGSIFLGDGYALLAAQNSQSGLIGSVGGTVTGSDSLFSFGDSNNLFSASLASSSGGGSSGGAPSPEVSTGLGIILAGATFAFLRRKRGAPNEATAA